MNREAIEQLFDQCERDCQDAFARVEKTEKANTKKVLDAFARRHVGLRHFAPTNGYGYDDIGRDTLGELYKDVLGSEAALVRPQIASGTHALALCLYGILRPGDVLLAASGRPYDTMEQVIGLTGDPGNGSLRDFGIEYREVALNADGSIDLAHVLDAIDERVRLVQFQRSRGYQWRPSLPLDAIGDAIRAIRKKSARALVMVDNCYGEFTNEREPGDVGADIFAGSLIKNAGGGLAPSGAYIAGSREAVELASYRLTSPGIGAEVGAYEGGYRAFYQGLFMAPHATAQALKGAILAARVFEKLGYPVEPPFDAPRNDIVESIMFREPEKLIRFIQAIQRFSPIDSDAVPEPWAMPGYEDPVIMAAGTFVAGASIELSADAPIREPYTAYLQGGLTYLHARIALEGAVEAITREDSKDIEV